MHYGKSISVILPLLATTILSVPAQAAGGGTTWFENNNGTDPSNGCEGPCDAGLKIGTAQNTTTAGAVSTINGALGGDDIADVFKIHVPTSGVWRFTTMGGNTPASPLFPSSIPAGADTQLFLFTAAGLGVRANDDTRPAIAGGEGSANSTLQTHLTAGDYLIGVSYFNNDPFSERELCGGTLHSTLVCGADIVQEAIFPVTTDNDPHFNEDGPTGPGGGGFLAGWFQNNTNAVDPPYTIDIASVRLDVAVPEPGSFTVFGMALAGLGLWRRRRTAK